MIQQANSGGFSREHNTPSASGPNTFVVKSVVYHSSSFGVEIHHSLKHLPRVPFFLFLSPMSEIPRVHHSARSIIKTDLVVYDEGLHSPTLPQGVLCTEKRLTFKGL